MPEHDPLLPMAEGRSTEREDLEPVKTLRERTAVALEHRRTHQFVIFLTLLDTGCVLADLGYTLLAPGCEPPKDGPMWLEVLANISLVITSAFLVEILLTLWSLGFHHYNPFGEIPHASLHLFDAVIITVTFVLEFVLRGKERELAELIIVLRLWRLVKLVGGVAVGESEIEGEQAEELANVKEQLQQAREEIAALQEHNRALRALLARTESPSVVSQ